MRRLVVIMVVKIGTIAQLTYLSHCATGDLNVTNYLENEVSLASFAEQAHMKGSPPVQACCIGAAASLIASLRILQDKKKLAH